ncbi:MAG TPA: helicase-exonuclease AddAB subunit AddB [Clostridia bacterium]
MSLRFIYGRAGSGKTRFCLNEIKSRINDGTTRPLLLLVPEQFTYQTEKDLIKVLGMGGILKTEVLSFRRLAFRIFNETGGITYPHVHPAGKNMILYRILDKLRQNLNVFAGSTERQGFVNTLSNLITEFKRYNVTPDALLNVCGRFDDKNPLKNKLSEIAVVYDLFNATIMQRYKDPDDDLTAAAKSIARCNIYNGAEIWIDGFSGFTPQEYAVIEQLMLKAERVNISFCTDCLADDGVFDQTGVFSPIKASYAKLVKISRQNGIAIEPAAALRQVYRFTSGSELSHLERYLYAYPYKQYEGKTRNLSLFSSVNMYSEIEECARDIVRLCRDHGIRFKDIAVITGNLSGYEKMIEVVFSEYGIPCFIDRKVDIANHPLVRMILSMLDIFIENWSYESVFSYLKTGLTGIDPAGIDRLENYVLACGIRGKRWIDDNRWNMIPDLIPDETGIESESEMLEDVNKTRDMVVNPLKEFRWKTKGRRKASEFCSCLYDFLCGLGVPERIEQSIEKFRNDGDLNTANEYSQVWNIVMEVLDQTVEVMGDETFGVERFASMLKIGFDQYRIGLIPPSLDQVLVGSIERSRSHEIKALYILGANDGIFPPLAITEGVLSDHDRNMLNNAGIELAGDSRKRAFEGQYMIYRTLTSSREYVRISWPVADNEGRALRPSIIISRLKKLFPDITETSNVIPETAADEMKLLAGRLPAFRQMVAMLRQKADGKNINPIWPEAYRWFFADKNFRDKCLAARAAFQYRNTAQPVSRDRIGALYGERLNSSVSRLEKYSSCPFAFFVQYGLDVRERKVYALRPPDIGTFMHSVIEKYSRLLSESDISWRDFDFDWCTGRVSEIVEQMLREMRGSGIAGSKRYAALASRLKRVVSRAVWIIAKHIRCGGFNPVEYEVFFGENGKYPPIIIELDSGEKVCLTGRIDRIDAFESGKNAYIRIVDYKSGSKEFKLSDVFYGLQIQLITYLDAIWESDKSYLPGGMLYFKIDDPIIKRNGKMTPGDIEKAIMKQLKMKGLLLADVKLIKEMDRTMEGSSAIIPASISKEGTLGRNTSAATIEQFISLRKHVKKLLKDICGEIMKGNVSIKPYKKKKDTSCKYCGFLPVCQFDNTLEENSFRFLHDIDSKSVWGIIEQGSHK